MHPGNDTTRRIETCGPLAYTHGLASCLNSGDGPGSVVINAFSLPIDLNAFGAEGAPAKPVALEVIPPPGATGLLPSRNGRRQRVADAAKLATVLNAQPLAARVDFDHRSEPASPTFSGTTAAEGWLSQYRLNARGGIDADIALGPGALESVRAQRYRYVSPAVLLNATGDVIALSSIALVNNPNLPLEAPTLNSEATMDEKELQAKQAKLDEREAAVKSREDDADKAALNAAAQAVDTAIEAARVLPAQKDYHLGAIKAHAEGIWKGIEVFNAFAGSDDAEATRNTTETLTHRIGPRGTPPSGASALDAEFTVPSGWQPPSDERIALHAKIAEYATKRGIPYRQALVEFSAINSV